MHSFKRRFGIIFSAVLVLIVILIILRRASNESPIKTSESSAGLKMREIIELSYARYEDFESDEVTKVCLKDLDAQPADEASAMPEDVLRLMNLRACSCIAASVNDFPKIEMIRDLARAGKSYSEILKAFNETKYDFGAKTSKCRNQTKRYELREKIAAAKAYISSHPNTPDGYVTLASISGVVGDSEEQVANAQKAVSIAPDNVNALLMLGVGLTSLGKPDRARDALTRAEKLDPENAEVQNSLGVVADQKSESESAINYYRKATELDPSYSDAWFNLAASLKGAKRLSEASNAISRYLTINPDDPEALEKQEDIRKQKDLIEKSK